MWYCHEVPDPHCASCNGTFVEQLENPADDPREFQHIHDGWDDNALPPNMNDFFTSLFLRGGAPRSPTGASFAPGAQRSRSEGATGRPDRPGGLGEGGGLSIRIQGSPDGRMRSMFIGGSRPRGGANGPPPFTTSFMTPDPETRREVDTIDGSLMMQYLLAMLANRPGRGGLNDAFGGLMGMPGGAENGQFGDYVFNQEALDQIISQIMENSNGHAPVPATEEVMNNLPRTVLEEGSDLLEKDCAVCKEQFKLETEDPDEQVVVTLPCKHPFHEPCIMPWLKSSGTCPVCRYQLIPQPEHHAPGPGPPGGSGSGSGSGSGRSPSPERNRRSPPSPNDRGSQSGSGLFSGLFGFATGSNGSNRQQPGNNRSGTHSSQEQSDINIPGGWGDQID